MSGPETFARPVEYQVSVFPDEMFDSADMATAEAAHMWALTVAYRGRGLWAVTGTGRQCLSRDGEWDWELRPSERADDWLAAHRFPLDAALALAAEYAPKIIINGHTAREMLAKHQARAARLGPQAAARGGGGND